ncbi:hypothetical protein [Bacteroides sp. 519]|uniref:hypothetical protein n=1 Tax=Bacteroides sp. 519 TaxID=2302937 RepID=UPI0013D72EAE|nr:hypothetical protein [Bacteroides sp. 519]NDV60292.1 hypothetical protein [Bacteroides sp. 519]
MIAINQNQKISFSLFLFSVFFILVIDNTSLFSYCYSLLLFFVLSLKIEKKKKFENYIYFHFYLLCCLIIYLVQIYTLPNYLGLTGPEGGVGTDDVRYFAQLVDFRLPYTPTVIADKTYPYVTFLKVLYPFSINSPLNILIPNLLGICFLPYLTYKFTQLLLNNEKISFLAQRLVLFCPFIIANGIILMRDAWIVTFLLLSFCSFLNKNYIVLIFSLLLISYIRFGSIVFAGVGIFILSRDIFYNKLKTKKQANLIYIITFIVFVSFFVLIMPFLIEISAGKFEGLFRESYLRTLAQIDEDSTLVKLMLLPKIIGIPLLAAFFLFSPFLNFEIYTSGIFNLRYFLSTTLCALYLIFCWRYIFAGLLISFNKKNIQYVSLIILVYSLLLGTISLQFRHKTIMMPFLYILTAYGFYSCKSKFNNFLSISMSIFILFIQLYYWLR